MNEPTNAQPPLVSIVLTTLNAARYLREALDSCLNQTYANLELIVVDGGSTDGTLEILGAHDDPRLRVIHQPDNTGKLPGAINLGLGEARGAHLTWMQADCVYEPAAIERMVSTLEAHPAIGHVYADYWQIDEQGKRLKVERTCEPDEILKAKSDPCGVCFMLRRTVREAVGPHDVSTHPNHDSDYRWRIALLFPSQHIPEPLYSWRLHASSLSGTTPWYVLARNDVPIRRRLGLLSAEQVGRELAAIDMARAFESYQSGCFEDVPALVWSGLRRDPAFARNRGVWAILFKSMQRQWMPHA